MKALIVIDMQNDFLTGSLGNKEASSIVPAVIKEIDSFDGEVYATLDTHGPDYLSTNEGHYLPVPHCLLGTPGHEIEPRVLQALEAHPHYCGGINKPTFGFDGWDRYLSDDIEEIELIGVCTDICVMANAVLLKTRYPNAKILVKASCCAGVTPKLHQEALDVMKSLQVEVLP